MKEIMDDFSDSIIYLGKLFGLKRLSYYDFNGYPIWYKGKKKQENGEEIQSDRLPEENDMEGLSAILVSVVLQKGENPTNVEFRSDKILFPDDVSEQKLRDFVFVLDRSMFRYF